MELEASSMIYDSDEDMVKVIGEKLTKLWNCRLTVLRDSISLWFVHMVIRDYPTIKAPPNSRTFCLCNFGQTWPNIHFRFFLFYPTFGPLTIVRISRDLFSLLFQKAWHQLHVHIYAIELLTKPEERYLHTNYYANQFRRWQEISLHSIAWDGKGWDGINFIPRLFL